MQRGTKMLRCDACHSINKTVFVAFGMQALPTLRSYAVLNHLLGARKCILTEITKEITA